MPYRISVIIPAYNVEHYLEQCVNSVINQTFDNLDIILVDDGSSDHSSEICDIFSKKDNRIRVIHKNNGGLSSARNAGLDIVEGDYIGFVDSDDFLLSEMYMVLLQLCLENSCDIAVCKTIDISNRRVPLIENTKNNPRIYSGRELLDRLYDVKAVYNMAPCNKLYRRGLFSQLRFPNGRIYEDESIICPLLLQADKVVITNDIYYCYYLSPNSIMRSNFSERRFDSLQMFRERLDFLRNNGLEDLFRKTQAMYYYRICELYYRMMNSNINSKEKWERVLLEEREKLLKLNDEKRYFDKKWVIKCDTFIDHPHFVKFREKVYNTLRHGYRFLVRRAQ